MGYGGVHGPYTEADRHQQLYDDAPPTDVPVDIFGPRPTKPKHLVNYTKWKKDAQGAPIGFDARVKKYNRAVAALDEGVGRLVEVLKSSGQLDNTLLVFTSDNGFQFGEHGLIDKRTMYEASIRVPLIVRGPDARGGRRQPQMILNLDFAPTFAELAGAGVPATMQGESFLPLLANPDKTGREAFLYEYFWERAFPQTPTVLGIRTDRYKLMRYHGVWDRYELYDLMADPDERNNLLADYMTTTEIGHVEVRVLGGRTSFEQSFLGTGTDDPQLRALFLDLWQRLDALIEENGAAREPNWRPRFPD